MLNQTVTEDILIAFTLNGEPVERSVAAQTRLVDVLRDDLHLTGAKIGCSIGRCGACMVHVDGVAMNACLLFAWQVAGKAVATVEGTATDKVAACVKAGLLEESSFQCGYCAPGFVMSLTSFLTQNPKASDAEVLQSLEGNICRCTGYHAIERGALNAAARVRAMG